MPSVTPWIVASALLVLSACVWPTEAQGWSGGSQSADIGEMMTNAQSFLTRNQLEHAAQEFNKVATRSPRCIRAALSGMGKSYQGMRKSKEAFDAYTRAILCTEDTGFYGTLPVLEQDLYYERALALIDVQEWDLAQLDLEEGVKIEREQLKKRGAATSERLEAYLHKSATQFIQMQVFSKGEARMRELVKLAPNNAGYWALLAQVCSPGAPANDRMGMKAWAKVLEVDPNNAFYWYGQGRLAGAYGEREMGEYSFGRSLRIDPMYKDTYTEWLELLEKWTGDHARAVSLGKLYLKLFTGRLSNEDMGHAHHGLANAYHGLGQYGASIYHFDEALKHNPWKGGGEYLNSWHTRQYALFHHHHLDVPFSEYNPDRSLSPVWMDGFGQGTNAQALSQDADFIPQRPMDPSIQDVEAGEMFGETLTGDAKRIADAVNPLTVFYHLRAQGFHLQQRACHGMAVAVVDLAQQVRQYWRSLNDVDGDGPILVANKASSGGCDGGFYRVLGKSFTGSWPEQGRIDGRNRRDPNYHAEKPGIKKTCTDTTAPLHHEFYWRDMFDIGVKWRQLTEPAHAVLWCDWTLMARDDEYVKSSGFAQTKVIDGDILSVKYYHYFPKCFDRLKEIYLRTAPKSGDAATMERVARINASQNIQEFQETTGSGGYFWNVLDLDRITNPKESIQGTKFVWEARAKPYQGYRFWIHTSRERWRNAEYDLEMRELFRRISEHGKELIKEMDAHDGHCFSDSCLMRRTAIARLTFQTAYLWVNFMPLNRGTAGTAYAVIQGLLLSAGISTTSLQLPPMVQLDWEAMIEPNSEKFASFCMKHLLDDRILEEPSLDVEALPVITEMFPTARHIISYLNTAVHSRPFEQRVEWEDVFPQYPEDGFWPKE